MKESFPMSEFITAELDAIARLLIRDKHHNLTKEERIKLIDKQSRYIAYKDYIEKQVNHLEQHHDESQN